MIFKETLPTKVPMDLLLEADPSEKSIATYLSESWCFVALKNKRMVAACVVKPLSGVLAEIFNVSVLPECQQKGIGSKLLRYALAELSNKGVKRVELGTGTFGYQLTYYQRLGFRVDSVVKDHFVDNYAEAIFESGIQHKDMLRLYIQL
ncbi:GNAT family N-acetyltransferase [Vibrio tubiashii]|uniref:GNAT family N-acetyltransferase n=1 Tax=Vibrio tubiashii TaxID=29498 RepID=UPI00234FA4B0|nr:GNAT family N-acetyltransferase [Vibrio tubiashii]WCP69825.1 GNAT family N-acetyltransferase [Vibrio tubiashii]